MGYRPGGVTGRVAGAKWQGQNEFHVEKPTKAIIWSPPIRNEKVIGENDE